jgi:predicted membrane-bound mannosyltransferase
MEKSAMFKFFAGYLFVCALLAWAVTQASPWIASHLLLNWIL